MELKRLDITSKILNLEGKGTRQVKKRGYLWRDMEHKEIRYSKKEVRYGIQEIRHIVNMVGKDILVHRGK
jgi:intein-encoded DNA endonuclease-like protein